MFIHFVSLASVLLLLTTKNVNACDCSWGGSFVEMAKHSELVVRGKVLSYGPKLSHGDNLFESMTVQILDVRKGNHKSDSLVILGDPGNFCRPYISTELFIIEQEYLFALAKSNQDPQEISNCGEYWIAIDGNQVRGKKLKDGQYDNYQISLKEILKEIE